MCQHGERLRKYAYHHRKIAENLGTTFDKAKRKDFEKLIKQKKLGYRSRAEFVAEACRERILRIKESP